MKTMSKSGMITGILCAIMAAALPQAALAQGAPSKQLTAVDLDKMKPSGTVVLDEKEIRLIIGGDRGKGVLNFQGKQYNFTVKGLTAGGIGVARQTFDVYFVRAR